MAAKGLALLGVLCTLVHALSGEEGRASDSRAVRAKLTRRHFAHLQPDIDEWNRLGKPTKAVFQQNATADAEGLLVAVPQNSPSLFGTDYAANIKYYVYNRAQPGGVVVDLDAAALLAAGFNRTLRTTVVIHGYGHDITDKLYDNVARALLDVGAATNVLAVDWGTLCPKPFYLSARSRVAAVGGRVADLLGLLVDADLARLADVHLVGHSLGAHVAGVAGRRHKVARITGLDPAQPLFTQSSSDLLTASSADLVDVVHTCVGSLGFRQPLGHVDFYPNRGRLSQPGCSFAADKLTLGECGGGTTPCSDAVL
ncbi:hypothetical protein ONE63_004753 [Megalurothrips usitatus]|uniref:Lipase domain-containing protein n=1 Tax=Megalurothrips usitatus TaxID=439358 RepID=A0AAV7X496_9NEOP|nr:hypothetical protein ONE63_004753 [Megalurothrips usitatus]